MSRSFEACQHVDRFEESFEPRQTPDFPSSDLTSDNSVIGSDNSSNRRDLIRAETMLARRENNCGNRRSVNIHYLRCLSDVEAFLVGGVGGDVR